MSILARMENQKRRMNNMESDLSVRMTKMEAEMDAIKNRVSGIEQRKKKVREVKSVQDNGNK